MPRPRIFMSCVDRETSGRKNPPQPSGDFTWTQGPWVPCCVARAWLDGGALVHDARLRCSAAITTAGGTRAHVRWSRSRGLRIVRTGPRHCVHAIARRGEAAPWTAPQADIGHHQRSPAWRLACRWPTASRCSSGTRRTERWCGGPCRMEGNSAGSVAGAPCPRWPRDSARGRRT